MLTRPPAYARPASVLEHAIRAGAFPAAVAEAGDATRPRWREAFGRLTFAGDAADAADDTVFDLASLTKVLATTPLVMQQCERGALSIDDRISRHLPGWSGTDLADVTIRDLLAHCGGLAAYAPLYQRCLGRDTFEEAICRAALEYQPRTRSVYSDLGFMLLGFILGAGLPLEARFDALRLQMSGAEDLQFTPPATWRTRMAPTEVDPWRGRLLVGEVHDENASALGGAAGHAGLFGTAAAVGEHARHLLQVLDGRTGAFQRSTLDMFVARRADIPGSSRALGWDTMLPTSSCGRRLSPRAFGHTGFTGTSLWIDPDRGIYAVLLTNRVHPSRQNDAIREVRPAFHDALIEGMEA